MISPQLGHGNFVGSVPGAMILWHDVHIGMATVTLVFSAILTPSKQCRYGYSGLYILCYRQKNDLFNISRAKVENTFIEQIICNSIKDQHDD